MNPTTEQLNKFAAEAKGWTNITKSWADSGWSGVMPPTRGFLCIPSYSTDLSQAWMLVHEIIKKGLYLKWHLSFTGLAVETDCGHVLFELYLEEDTPKGAAYALTLAFVKVMNPPSYVAWVEEHGPRNMKEVE